MVLTSYLVLDCSQIPETEWDKSVPYIPDHCLEVLVLTDSSHKTDLFPISCLESFPVLPYHQTVLPRTKTGFLFEHGVSISLSQPDSVAALDFLMR